MTDRSTAGGMFRREGEYWSIRYDQGANSHTVRLKDMKGLQYLSQLLGNPEREHHVLELVAATRGGAVVMDGASMPALDGQAIAAYRQRMVDLELEIEDAEGCCDLGRKQRAQVEHELLRAQLVSACGLSGRSRPQGHAERARKAVRNRISGALTKIENAHRGLGRHLRNSVSTGTFCMYRPERPLAWEID